MLGMRRKCLSGHTDAARETQPRVRRVLHARHQALGAASDVNGLLLGRQQSVHGSRHCLHVNLRTEHMLSGAEAQGPEAGGTEVGVGGEGISHHGGI